MVTLFASLLSVYAQWTVQNSGFTTASRGIRNISIVDANVVWATAYDGSAAGANIQEFTKTSNGGTTWTPGTINIGSSSSGIAMVHALDINTAWIAVFPNAAGQSQGIYKTTNGGGTWTRQNTAAFTGTSAFANVVYFFDANNGVCMGDPNGGYFEIYTTTNGGTNWVRVPQANIPANLTDEYGYTSQIYTCGDGNTVWFTTNMGRIYRSSNRGLNWVVFQSPLTDFGGSGESGDISFKDANNGFLINNGALYWTTTDGGANWNLDFANSGTIFPGGVAAVPGTDAVFTVGAATGASGSSYSLNGFQPSPDFVDVDAIQHLGVVFLNNTTGWSGGFNTSATVGGMFKWTTPVVSVTSEFAAKGLMAFPNPVQDKLQLSANENIDQVAIYNSLGQLVLSVKPNNILSTVDMSALAHGTYVAKITIGTAEGALKIVK